MDTTSTSSRILSLLVPLLAGALVACASRPHPPFDADGTNAILVGPGPNDLSIPNAYLWEPAGDVAVWVSRDRTKLLYIDFEKEIFEGMDRQENGLYRVKCQTSRCDSGAIKRGTEHNIKYKYTQTLVDSSGELEKADGMIIIKP
jgi:hypothetical protein